MPVVHSGVSRGSVTRPFEGDVRSCPRRWLDWRGGDYGEDVSGRMVSSAIASRSACPKDLG
jgi:hypothetical protein